VFFHKETGAIMVYTITVDSTVYTKESDREIRYAIIGRVVAADDPAATGIAPPPKERQVLGWCSTRDEAEQALQHLFSQRLFADLEIVPAGFSR
jgi:hypothetical protein